MINRKKLIEVALPLDAINAAAAREKSIRHGHPSTLHLWWARRPLAVARAVLFAQTVDDPGSWPDQFPSVAAQDAERKRLFALIEELVKWDNNTNDDLLNQARQEILDSWKRTCADHATDNELADIYDPNFLPDFHDPFAGGGALPLEAQRLGLRAFAGDLNPVAVLINKAMIEIPTSFRHKPPVNPDWQKRAHEEKQIISWQGSQGLSDDVLYYAKWLRDEAQRRIGHLYAPVHVSSAVLRACPAMARYKDRHLKPIAWLWTRTVRSPNPAFSDVEVPLVSSFWLSKKIGKEAWIQPIVDDRRWRFEIRTGKPSEPIQVGQGTTAGRRQGFMCLMSGTAISYEYIRAEGLRGRMGVRLMAIVAEGDRERVYIPPTDDDETRALAVQSKWAPTMQLPQNTRDFKTPLYGLTTFGDLFTQRQLMALTTLSDLVHEVRDRVRHDAVDAGVPDDDLSLHDDGTGAAAYSDALAIYLGLSVSRHANFACTLSSWNSHSQGVRQAFGRQALPMVWDYCEVNPFSDSSGNLRGLMKDPVRFLNNLPASSFGIAIQEDAQSQKTSKGKIVSTDPPYYDNISYADLSDFFYPWLRRSLKTILPDLFVMMAAPKIEELVAMAYRHGNAHDAKIFFVDGMTKAMKAISDCSHSAFPVTVYYAFKQSETTTSDGQTRTGWETFLEAVMRAGFEVTGTWPMRTERSGRLLGVGRNVLASCIVIVCRKRSPDAPVVMRQEFRKTLAGELTTALRPLQDANIAPVDLAQAAIGPGMAVFSRYAKVVLPSGEALGIREALQDINEALDDAAKIGFDTDTQWAIAWFSSHGFGEGYFGQAEVLANAKNTSIVGLVRGNVLESHGGRVRLLRPRELRMNEEDGKARRSVWEYTHQLLQVYSEKGEMETAKMLVRIGNENNRIRDLAYCLFLICEQEKWNEEGIMYNDIVQSWPEILLQAKLKKWIMQEMQKTIELDHLGHSQTEGKDI